MAAMSAQAVQDAISGIERDGYVVLPQVVDRDQLKRFSDDLADAYEAKSNNGELFRGGGSLSGHLNCYPGEGSRFIYDAVSDHGILDVVRHFGPEKLSKLRVTTNYNLPGSRAQHYHPDGLYTEAFLICNVAVVDTSLDNGAIDVLPQTHHRFYKFWRYAIERKWQSTTRVPMQAGDVLLRISTMWHRGMPNSTTTPRPMMSLTFGEESAPEVEPFSVHGGEIAFTPNWYGTDRLGELREKAFVTMPWLYSTSRFARSLVGNKGYSSW